MPLSVREYLEQGAATSKEIQARTGLSQTAVARHLRSMGDTVVKVQSGRSPRYAVTRTAFGGDDRLPLVVVDAQGGSEVTAYIRPLAHGGFFVERAPGMATVLLGENGDGLYDDLPYFLYDLRPQGFLGRYIAEEMAGQSGDFPADPRRWNTHHIGRYLVSNGDDLPGNFKFGQQAYLRVRRAPVVSSEKEYPALADSVMSGNIPVSSAGGEQPKFTVFCNDCFSHVIVKFSPRGTSDIARRWRDILITEYHATQALKSKRYPVAETRLIEGGGRLFLESQRFDRLGEYGRMSMLSLHAVDAEFVGLGGDWPRVMDALCKKNLVQWQDVLDAEVLWLFGRLIHNTDMHLGNVGVAIEGDMFRLLPVYDMCSMGFAPRSGGEVLPYRFVPPAPKGINITGADLGNIMKMAHDFWERVGGDERISGELREFLGRGNPVELG